MTFWRDQAGHEIDFVLGDDVAIAVKAASMVTEKHLKSLRLEGVQKQYRQTLVVSLDTMPRTIDSIEVIPCTEFLNQLWSGRFDPA